MPLKTVDFVAGELGVKKQRVYELVRQNFFPSGVVKRLGKRQIRINEEAFRNWIAEDNTFLQLSVNEETNTQ